MGTTHKKAADIHPSAAVAMCFTGNEVVMRCLQIRTRLFATAIAVVLLPALVHAETDGPAKKDAPAGRQRLNPKSAEDAPGLKGVPGDANVTSPGSLPGCGPMSGNPLFGPAVPLKSGN